LNSDGATGVRGLPTLTPRSMAVDRTPIAYQKIPSNGSQGGLPPWAASPSGGERGSHSYIPKGEYPLLKKKDSPDPRFSWIGCEPDRFMHVSTEPDKNTIRVVSSGAFLSMSLEEQRISEN
jgi:hypothetical protein